MSATHRILFVPALDDRLLDGGAMPRLRARAADAQRAALLVSGLDLPECLIANALWGAPPTRHGITLAAGEEPSPLEGSLGPDCVRADSLAHASSARLQLFVEDRLLQSALREGAQSEAMLDRARELDEIIVGWIARDDAVHWVLGGSVARPQSTLLEPPDGAVCRGAIAEWNRDLAREEQDALLRRPGIERVLQGESLLAWGLPRTVAIAEPGCGFDDHAATIGHPDAPAAAPILCFGGSFRRPWPRSLHDLRIAPTLANALGLEELDFLESAID